MYEIMLFKEIHFDYEEFSNINSKMLEIREHARNISIALNYISRYCNKGYEKTSNWLWLASSIQHVEIDRILYDDSFCWCRPAYKYEEEKQLFHSKLINELTTFLYTYSAIESLITEINPNACPFANGKINAAKFFILSNFSKKFNFIKYYCETIGLIRKITSISTLKEYTAFISTDLCTDINGIALKFIYKVRNSLAHGSYEFPEPDEWRWGSIAVEPEIILLSTRCLLFSVQMLLLSLHGENNTLVEINDAYLNEDFDDDDLYKNSVFPVNHWLSVLHIRPLDKIDSQTQIFAANDLY